MDDSYPTPQPSAQENFLLALHHGAAEKTIARVEADLYEGISPSILSVVRPDLLVDFAEAWHAADTYVAPALVESYKSDLFTHYYALASEGNSTAIVTLPKFVSSTAEMTATAELVLAHQETLNEQADRVFLQYLSTFNPQHIGHRIAIASALQTVGPHANALVHLMGAHPLKPNIQASYPDRYRDSEARLYTSPLLDTAKVTQVDVPGGMGLASRGLDQMKLLAASCGDTSLRWLIGSDKLIHDATAIRRGQSIAKALLRFAEPQLHAYVIHRQSDELDALQEEATYIHERFGTSITIVPELPYDCAPASSTRIRQLRADGRHAEADHMEFYELLP